MKASDARRALLASPRIRGAGSGEERRTILLPWDCENTPWRRSSRTRALATSPPGQDTVEERRRRRDAVSAAGMLWRGSVAEQGVAHRWGGGGVRRRILVLRAHEGRGPWPCWG